MDNALQPFITRLSSDDVRRYSDFPADQAANNPDPLIDYFHLTDSSLRRRLETPRGIYMAESMTVIERAIEAGHRPRSILLEEKWLPKMEPLLHRCLSDGPLPIYVASQADISHITGYRVHRGALAAMHRPHLPSVQSLVSHAHRLVVLEDIVDHTNVGAIFRSAAALNIDAILVTPRCADPLYRRSVRVSMGTVFQIPWTRMNTWPPTKQLHQLGFVCVALALRDDSVSLADFEQSDLIADPSSQVALMFGSEGPGLTPLTLSEADIVVRIPMSHGVDSLNVAAASAVVFWACRPRVGSAE